MSMNNTFVWVLRFALAEFLVGIVALVGGVYVAFNLPGDDPHEEFVPVVAMFGVWPYVLMAAIGCVFLVVAWQKGSAWKNGKFGNHREH